MENGVSAWLLRAGAVCKPCFCGPCFGAGDVPANDALSIRHTTRNFPNREGSKPGDGQLSGVILMDARSIAATARNHGVLTSAADVDYDAPVSRGAPVRRLRVRQAGLSRLRPPQPDAPLQYGPNIAEWPAIPALSDDLLLQVASVLRDEVTTTDELIPSGETSSYRSNPMKLAQFTPVPPRPGLCAPGQGRGGAGKRPDRREVPAVLADTLHALGLDTRSLSRLHIGSVIFANKPGDGSAREQAASCQRVLGGSANICYEFATKRYRSNCVNWGLLPFTLAGDDSFDGAPGDFIYVPEVREKVARGDEEFPAVLLHDGRKTDLLLYLKNTNAEERELLLRGCLINYYAAKAVN